ncbi:MAG: hypothetical protein GX847_05810, partial [Clostridiales bacterium]|nr:hypothetical protein [Clostridiales bacterium]
MAVVKMELMSIIGPLAQFDEVVRDCLVERSFYIENPMTVLSGVKGLSAFNQTNPLEEHLKKAVSLCRLMGVEPDYREFDHTPADNDAIMDYMNALAQEYGSLKERLDQNRRTINGDEHIILQLRHFSSLSIDIDAFFNSKYVKYRFGRIPIGVYETYGRQIENSEHLFFFPTSSEKDYIYGMFVALRQNEATADAQMASFQFERVHISGRVKGTANEAIAAMAEESRRLEEECSELEARLNDIAERETQILLSKYSYIRYMHDTYDMRRYCLHSSDMFYVVGWIEKGVVEEFTKKLERHPKLIFSFDDPELFINKVSPPIKLKNPKIFRPFQEFVKMYGIPNYREIDPTPLFALTYPFLFGIMFGDVGQGFVIFLASLLYYQKKKSPIVLAFTFSGFFSVLFGFVYGSCFGSEELLGYKGFRVLTSA